MPDYKYYNDTGRGYPDISALGGEVNKYCVVVQGNYDYVAGTSASAPVAAGVFALLNNERLNAGKSVLGFLNPWIYGDAKDAFNDVVLGDNGDNGPAGFECEKGWDPGKAERSELVTKT